MTKPLPWVWFPSLLVYTVITTSLLGHTMSDNETTAPRSVHAPSPSSAADYILLIVINTDTLLSV